MELKDLKAGLQKSVSIYQRKMEEKELVIKEEIREMERLIKYLSPVLPEKRINGKKAVLIYVFAESKKKTVSPDVYYCEDGNIRYQVYLKDDYYMYNPNVEYEGAYAVVDTKEMFSKRNGLEFSDIVEFFVERVESLEDMAGNIEESAQIRRNYLNSFKKLSKKI